ncbi:MAG: helix-turn-helix domain-containing protein [Candidatus Odinarchaeota archaeon]
MHQRRVYNIKRAEARSKSSRADFHLRTALMKVCETSNEFIVTTYLLDHGPATRGDIVKSTPVKWTTAYDSLVRLHVKGIVKREVVTRGRGRPLVLWSLNL